jgi:hypothetical protein
MERYLMYEAHDFYLLILGFNDGSLLMILFWDIYTMWKWAMLPALSNRPTGESVGTGVWTEPIRTVNWKK